MRAVFLGTGTSVGVPAIGCDCPVCRSADRRNRRLRTSLYLETPQTHLVVDTTPDFREQVLSNGIRRLDAVLFTHSHADHVFGLDDVRRFNTIQKCVIPAYGAPGTMADIQRIYAYVDDTPSSDGISKPRIAFRTIDGPFRINDIRIEPLTVLHGSVETLGFLFRSRGRSLAYVPDCAEMPATTLDAVHGVDVMILDALRRSGHKTHLSLDQSLSLLERIEAGKSYIVHLCHDLDHETTQACMPAGMFVSYDGLVLDL